MAPMIIDNSKSIENVQPVDYYLGSLGNTIHRMERVHNWLYLYNM